ncbi:MAG TPA: hypothetical protein VK627_01760 [Edaphobacter sp.]|jgi:hypothetical protein|nr:hypothetical protein [Edaphobacter sp.]
MDPIRVPRPPASAFHKNRPVSDLLASQIEHFQHIEAKLEPEHRSPFAPHEIVTENAAAQYITHMTNLLRGQSTQKAGPVAVPRRPAKRSSKPLPKPEGRTKAIALAAAADKAPARKRASAAKKKAAHLKDKRKKS